jgi:hypothetical protein
VVFGFSNSPLPILKPMVILTLSASFVIVSVTESLMVLFRGSVQFKGDGAFSFFLCVVFSSLRKLESKW